MIYILEFYDRDRDWEHRVYFSKRISPQQALNVFNRLEFKACKEGKLENPLNRFDNKDLLMENFNFRLSKHDFIMFYKEELGDYLLEYL